MTMGIETLDANVMVFTPGIADPHTHPRAFDPITSLSRDEETGLFIPDGKAGFRVYSEEALRSGITMTGVMPNEQMRIYDPNEASLTRLIPYPISNIDKVYAMQSLLGSESYVPGYVILGLNPEEIYYERNGERVPDMSLLDRHFEKAGDECMALKVYGDETTGGFNVHPRDIPDIALKWHGYHPTKPVILHLENDNVGAVLRDLGERPGRKDVPIHIAHVSSREELTAVMWAKEQGMNVTCEVTPHHLFLDESARDAIGGYAMMKPTLKSREDVQFLWDHIDQIDMIASDGAPHRVADKIGKKPTPGVTNQREMLPLSLGAVQDGRITMEELYQKLCIAPRRRFNLPIEDGSQVVFRTDVRASARVLSGDVPYPNDPFTALEEHGAPSFNMAGIVVRAVAGASVFALDSKERRLRTNLKHVIRPQTLGIPAVRSTIKQS